MRSQQVKWPLMVFLIVVIAGIGAIIITPLVITAPSRMLPPEIGLSLIVIGGGIALIVVLGVLVVIFSGFNLNDRHEALGLPSGSIRALIALLLILVFVIFALHLFGTSRGQTERFTGLNAAQLTKIIDVYGMNVSEVKEDDTGTYNVAVRIDPSPAAHDLGTQILTMLGTLTAAVAAFYFGTRSTESGEPSGAGAAELLTTGFLNGAPSGAADSSTTFTILGRSFNRPTVQLEGQGLVLPVVVLSWTVTEIVCRVDLPAQVLPGSYAVVVTNSDGSTARLLSFTV